MPQGTYAVLSEEYGDLPIIDVTHPAFRVDATDKELAAMSQKFANEQAQREQIPAEVRAALRRSVLGRALAAASGSYLSGMSTYLIKLGPGNLWPDAQEIDRKIAASLPGLASRIRLQDMARMLADGLGQSIAAEPGRRICIVNIAGGTAADSWNGLICVRALSRQMLDGRSIRIAVLDRDATGPAFGARAIHRLKEADAPLFGLEIGFEHIRYDWSESSTLAAILSDIGAAEAACAVSSEGGLFEYGSDDEIVSNLSVLRESTGAHAFVVGSVTRDCEAVRANGRVVASRPRTIEAFQGLAERAGWRLDEAIERPFSYHVSLRRG